MSRFAIAAVLLVVCAGSEVRAQSAYTDKETGFRITVPKDYEETGADFRFDFNLGGEKKTDYISTADHRLVSFRKDESKRGWGSFGRTTGLDCYYFPADLSAEIGDLGDKKFSGSRIYRDFQDFARDQIRGFFFTKEKETKVAGFPGKVYEMRFEKGVEEPMTWLAFAFDIPGGQFALVYRSADGDLSKSRGKFARSASTFKLLRKDGLNWMGLKDADREKVEKGITQGQKESLKRMGPEELAAWKEQRREELYQIEIDRLEKGWRAQREGDYLILSEGSKSFTKQVRGALKGMESWCEKTFGDVRFNPPTDPPYYPGGGIVFVRKANGIGISIGGASMGDVPRVTINESDTFDPQYELRNVLGFVVDAWLGRQHSGLENKLPGWFAIGLDRLMDTGKIKGTRISFPIDKGDSLQRFVIGQAGKSNAPWIPLQDVFTMPRSAMYQNRQATVQAVAAVRYLLVGPGAKSSKTKSLVQRILENTSEVMTEEEAAKREARKKALNNLEKKEEKKELTEEELLAKEDAEYKKRREGGGGAADSYASETVKKVNDRTFGYWGEKEWSALDRAVESYTRKILQ